MKLTVPTKPFAEALQWAAKHARPAGGDANPIWTGLHLEALADTVILRATTLDVWVSATVAATVHDDGVTVLPARLFADVAGRLRGDEVTLTLDATTAVLECGALRLETATMAADGWHGAPEMPPVVGSVVGGALRRAIERVEVAAGRPEQGMPELVGIGVTAAGDGLRLAATCRYQIAEAVLAWQPVLDHNTPVVVLAPRELAASAKDLPADDEVTLHLQADRIGLSWPGRTVVAAAVAAKPMPCRRALDGMRPVVAAECDRADLLDALAQVGPTVDRKAAARVTLRLRDGEIEVSARSGVGETSTALAASWDGPELAIVSNWEYLKATATSVGGARVRIGLMSDSGDAVRHAAALLTTPEDGGYRHSVGLLRSEVAA